MTTARSVSEQFQRRPNGKQSNVTIDNWGIYGEWTSGKAKRPWWRGDVLEARDARKPEEREQFRVSRRGDSVLFACCLLVVCLLLACCLLFVSFLFACCLLVVRVSGGFWEVHEGVQAEAERVS